VFGAILPRLFTAVLLAAFGVAATFVVTNRAHFVEGQKPLSGRPGAGREEAKLTVRESLREVRVFALDVAGRMKAIAGETERANWAVIGAVGLVLLALGLLLARLAGALVFSILGTALIFAGLIVLLMFKGSAPVTLVQKQGTFYGLVLLGMVAFGTLEQLALGPALRRRHRAGSPGAHPGSEESKQGWRNR
jgi:hypothetical protein